MAGSGIPRAVQTVCDTLWGAGWEAYPVGGCVRDLLLGRTPGDWDACTAAPPEVVEDLFGHTIPTGVKHGTVTVLVDGMAVEVTTFRREGSYADGRHPDTVTFDASLTQDLSRRDFTINAMALSPAGAVIDPFGGRADLAAGLIRCVGRPEERFAEDALRMLRGVRFAAQLGFTLEEETRRAMAAEAARTAAVSRERIRAELEKTLISPRPEAAGEMIALGLLDCLWDGWDKGRPLSALRKAEPTAKARWRAFCGLTGFPISALPVERTLRRAVEHPEAELIPALALTPNHLMALGLEGPQISAAQKKLALHLLDKPEDNTPERLREVLEEAAGEDAG